MKKLILIGVFLTIVSFGAICQEQRVQSKEAIENKLRLLEKQSGILETDSIFCYIIYEDKEHFHSFSVNDTVGVVLEVFREHFNNMLEENVKIYVHTWELARYKKLSYYNIRDKAVFRLEVVNNK